MQKIKLKIATPEKVVLNDEVDQITIPTENGEITILPNHIPLISNVVTGIMEAKKNGEPVIMSVSGGFLEFHDNELTLLADTAERAEEIDIKKAEEARKRAETLRMEQRENLDENAYANVVSRIEKQLTRIKVAKRYRSRSSHNIHLGE